MMRPSVLILVGAGLTADRAAASSLRVAAPAPALAARSPRAAGRKSSAPVVTAAAVGDTSAIAVNSTRHSALLDANVALAARWMALDVPEYRDCAKAMNTAWRLEAQSPCSGRAVAAANDMKAAVPNCGKLRQGTAYVASYRDLLRQSDVWCNGPACEPPCEKDSLCGRFNEFPFQATCTGTLEPLDAQKDGQAVRRAIVVRRLCCPWLWMLIALLPLPATCCVYRKHRALREDGRGPHCGVYSVLCCLCCTPATICCPIDASKY